MGLITTLGKFCFIECDGLNCNKKIEHIDIKLLKELSILCGWKKTGQQWLCPDCKEELSIRAKRVSRLTSRAKTRQSLS